MANVAENVKRIRKAVYGKEVRESIAAGIEAINAEVENTTSRQDVIDTNESKRIYNENIRIANEENREKAFEDNEKARDNLFISNEINRSKKATESENNRQNIFVSNEDNRQTTFEKNEKSRTDIFNLNESEREAFLNQFKDWYNSAMKVGRLPMMFDGGYFGDNDIDDEIYDGGEYGD